MNTPTWEKIPKNMCPMLSINREAPIRCAKSKCAIYNTAHKKCALSAIVDPVIFEAASPNAYDGVCPPNGD